MKFEVGDGKGTYKLVYRHCELGEKEQNIQNIWFNFATKKTSE